VFPLFVEDVGAVMRRTIVVLQFAVAFVLLIACANVANLCWREPPAVKRKSPFELLWARVVPGWFGRCSPRVCC